jgi:hypothetical protein
VTTPRVVAGWTVCAQAGRVWLHDDGLGDGDMPPAVAAQLAAALQAAALDAQLGVGDPEEEAIELALERRHFDPDAGLQGGMP